MCIGRGGEARGLGADGAPTPVVDSLDIGHVLRQRGLVSNQAHRTSGITYRLWPQNTKMPNKLPLALFGRRSTFGYPLLWHSAEVADRRRPKAKPSSAPTPSSMASAPSGRSSTASKAKRMAIPPRGRRRRLRAGGLLGNLSRRACRRTPLAMATGARCFSFHLCLGWWWRGGHVAGRCRMAGR